MEIATLIRALTGHDFGTWSRADIDGCLDRQAWREPDDGFRDHLVAAQGGWEWTAHRRQTWHLGNYGEFVEISCFRHVSPEVADAEHRLLLNAAVEVLGPPALVGGPGAFARWRRRDTTITVLRRLSLARSCRVELSIVPTEPREYEEHRRANADPDYQPEHRWAVRPEPGSAADQSLLGMMSYPHSYATSWEQLRANLADLFVSLASDIPALHPYASGIVWVLMPAEASAGRFAQGWFAPDECRLEIQPSTIDTLPSGREHGLTIARATVDALQAAASSPRQVRYRAFANIHPQRLDSIGFAVPNEYDLDPYFPDDNQ